MDKFKVSVIIPVYNAALFVVKAVESAVSLEAVNEVILIEDGSSDDSLNICKELKIKYPKVVLLQHENNSNRGAGASRNLGLRSAKSEFIAFLDADDYYLPNRFVNAQKLFNINPLVDGVFEAIGTHFYSKKAREKYQKNELTTLNEAFLNENGLFASIICGRGFAHLNGIVIKQSVLNKNLFFDEKLKQSQDTDFILNLDLKCYLIKGNLEAPVAMRGVHEQNRIHNVRQAKKYAKDLALKWIALSENTDWQRKVKYNLVLIYLNSCRDNALKTFICLLNLLLNFPFVAGYFKLSDFKKLVK